MIEFGDKLGIEKARRLITTAEMAERMGLSRIYLYKILRGKCRPTIYTIRSALRCGYITQEEAEWFSLAAHEHKNKPI